MQGKCCNLCKLQTPELQVLVIVLPVLVYSYESLR